MGQFTAPLFTQEPQGQQGPPVAPQNHLDAIVERRFRDLQAEREQTMRMSVHSAVYGPPEEGLVSQQKTTEDLSTEQALLHLARVNPSLHRLMSNLPTTRMIRDDALNLKLVSDSTDWWTRNVEAGETMNEAGMLHAKSAWYDLSPAERDRLAEIDTVQQMAALEEGWLDEAAKLVGQIWKPAAAAIGTGLAASAVAGAVSGPGAIISAPTVGTIASGSVYFAHTAMVEFGHQFNEIYTRLREKMKSEGIDDVIAHERARELAIQFGGGYALASAAIETLAGGIVAKPVFKAARLAAPKVFARGIPRATKARAAGTFAKETVLGYGAEIGQEGVQEVLGGIAANWAFVAANYPELQDSASDIFDRALSVMGKVAKGMAFIAPLGPMMHYGADLQYAKRAKLGAQHFENIRAAVEGTSLAGEAPDVMADVVDAASEGTGAENVFVEGPDMAEALKQSGVTREQLAQSLPDVAKQLAEAERTGGDVVMTMGEFAAHIAPSPALYAALQKKLRLTEQGYSLEQADAWLSEQTKNSEAAMKKVAEASSKVADWDEQAAAAKAEYLAYVRKSPRYTPREADMVAQFYQHWVEVGAAEDNVTPREFHEKHMVRVELNRQQGGLEQSSLFQSDGRRKTDTPEFGTFIESSSVKQSLFHFGTFDESVDSVPVVNGAGFHFGSRNAARDRVIGKAMDDEISGLKITQEENNEGELRWFWTGGDYDSYDIDDRGFATADEAKQNAANIAASAVDSSTLEELEDRGVTSEVHIQAKNPKRMTDQVNAAGWKEAIAEAKAQGHDSIVYRNDFEGSGEDSYIVFSPGQIKSVYNKGTFDPSNPDVLRQSGQSSATESLEAVTKIETANELGASKKWGRVRDLKVALQERTEAARAEAGVELTRMVEGKKGTSPTKQVVESQEVEDYLTRVGLNDALFALKQNPNAVGWYDLKTRQALAVMALVHPEIMKDEDARFAFTYALAVTSNGLKVSQNFELADEAYRAYKATGVMPNNVGIGNASSAINDTLAAFNTLKKKFGLEQMRKLMLSMGKASVFANTTGMEVSGEFATTEVLGASVLGPKIGNGFFANLYGMFDQLTMDRWLVRSWGRWTGTLLVERPDLVAKQTTRFESALTKLSPETKAAVEGLEVESTEGRGAKKHKVTYKSTVKFEEATVEEIAAEITKATTKKALREAILALGPEVNELRLAANNLTKTLDAQKEAPHGPSERMFIRKVFQRILAQLQQDPKLRDLTMADLQAVLWYAERRVYESAKEETLVDTDVAGYDDESAPDYAVAASKAAAATGVTDRKIKNALQREKKNAGRTRTTRSGTGQAQAAKQAGPGFSPRELRVVAGHAAAGTGRRARLDGSQPSWAVERRSLAKSGGRGVLKKRLGVRVAAEWKLGRVLANRYKDAGINTSEPLYELDPTDEGSALRFAEAITQFKLAKKKHGASVFVYQPEEYAGMTLMLSASGKSGVAVKADGDMVSVFSAEGMARPMVDAAVAAGATHADAFDIGLSELYAGHGFKVIARAKWSDKEAPPGWDKNYFNKHNKGEPDVVFYVVDHEYFDSYHGTEGGKPVSYGTAVKRQKAESLRSGTPDAPRGEYTPGVAWLNEEHDATTLLHEMSHHFMAVLLQRATADGAADSVLQQAATLLTWFGIEGATVQEQLANWNAMSIEEQRPHWESFASNFEIYLHEGKAPSVELESIFQVFSRWFRHAYRYVREVVAAQYESEFGKPLPALTREVTQVYDRMLASEDAILAAQTERGMAAMFAEKPPEWSDEAWAEYQKDNRASTEDAILKLTRASLRAMRWLGNAKSRLIKEIQKSTRKLRKEIEGEERAKLERQPVYRALRWLRTGEQVRQDGTFATPVTAADIGEALGASAADQGAPHKLDTQMVKDLLMDGESVTTHMSGLTHPKGMPPDLAAEMFDYNTGGALVFDLANHTPLDEAVQDAADARMLAEHADLLDEDTVARRVEEVLHNEHRAKVVGAELKFLAKITTPLRVMIRAARTHAREAIAAKKVSALRPHLHSAAEVRERRAAEKAMLAGDTTLASYHKRRELLEGQLVREAVAARDEIVRARKLFKKLFQADKKLGKTRDVDYIAVGRSLLARLGLAPGGDTVGADNFIEQLKDYNPALYEKLVPILQRIDSWQNETPRRVGQPEKSWQDLTVDEFREVTETVTALWQLSREERKVELNDVKEELDDVAQTVAVADFENPEVKVTEEPGSLTFGERVGDRWRGLKALAARPEHWFFRKDRAKDGGVFTRYFWRPIRAAVDRFQVDRTKYTNRLAAMVKKLRPGLRTGKIEMHDLNGNVIHVFGRGKGGFGHAELIGALLHSGNRSNLRKLIVGNKWGTFDKETQILDTAAWDAFRQRMVEEGYITPEVMAFVQQVWDLNEELKPLAQAAHKKLFGFRFKEIEATEFAVRFKDGTVENYRGGYIPAKLDRKARSAGRILDLKELEQDFRSQFATTGRGFAMERNDNFAEPLNLDIDLLPSHIDDVLRFAHLQPVINEVQRVGKHKLVQDAFARTSPGAWNQIVLPWLQRVASQSATKAGMNRDVDNFWRAVRSSTGITMMMGNLVNAAQQFSGLMTAALRVKPQYIFSAFFKVLGNRRGVYQDIADFSPGFMANRQKNQIYDSVQQINSLMQNKSKFATTQAWVKQHAYFAQTMTQNWIDAVIWSATFEQSLAEQSKTRSDEAAVKEATQRADAVIRMTQSSFDPTDVAGYTALTPFGKLFTQFSDWFNTMANVQADQFVRIANAAGFTSKAGVLFQTYLLGFAVPMIAAEAFAQWARGRIDDEDESGSAMDELLIEAVLIGHLRSAAAEVPIAGAGINAFFGWMDDKAWNDRMTSTPAISLLERTGKGSMDAIKALFDDEKNFTGKHVRDVLTTIGMAAGLPGGAVGKHAGAATDVGVPESFDDYRALITGATSKKQRDAARER